MGVAYSYAQIPKSQPLSVGKSSSLFKEKDELVRIFNDQKKQKDKELICCGERQRLKCLDMKP